MIKDILAVVEDGDAGAGFLRTVGNLAREHGAFLEVAALTPAPMTSPALAPFGSLYVPEVVLMGDDRANVAKVQAHLAETGCEHDVFGLHDDLAWLAGDMRRSRQIADLIIVGTEDSWPTPWLRNHVLETLIRSAGTPILILPTGQSLPPIRRAVLGWKPSPEANRAVHALAHLAEPGAVIDIVTVGIRLADCERERDTHAEVKRHLRRHGFAAEGHWIVNDEKIEAETLTLYAQEIQADLLAIGGFAHSRVRQILLGGVTRDLVRRADLPILISS
jgi:nucleotide-binding universal stress UspA family protein